MIDFRYHLVSLISVFLALAVGIVLGAGPLKEAIGTTLTDQVDSLRQEKDTLRADLDTSNAALGHRDEFITTVAPSLINGQLVGRSVTIVTLPGVDGDAVDPLTDAITTAGGTVAGRVSIGRGWVDPQQAAARAQVADELAGEVPADTAGTDTRLADLLAGALVSTAAGSVGRSTEAQTAVLEALQSADLIGIEGNLAGPAGAALVLAPAVAPSGSGQPVQPTTDPGALNAYVALALALDTAGGGAVVTGPASSATDGGVVAAVRNDGAAQDRVSTVDTGSQPAGVVTAVLAVREQLAGDSGAYGFGSGVSDPLPVVVGVVGATPSPTQ